MAYAIFKMSMFEMSLIFQLLFYVNGIDKNSFASTTGFHNDSGLNVTGIHRIVGGSPASIKEYPFMVSIMWRFGRSLRCGGTYILPRYVLTAAHCVLSEDRWTASNPYLLIVVVGTATLRYAPTWQVQGIEHILPHRGFNPRTMASDIALIRIRKPFRITPYVNFAPLPRVYDQHLISKYSGEPQCTVIGWGKTNIASSDGPEVLHHSKIPLIPPKTCSRYPGYHNILFDQLCGGFEKGGVDACQGDSGGPLLCGGVQVGVISWGLSCAAARAPGVYVRVDVHLRWINQTIMRNDGSSAVVNKFTMITSSILIWELYIRMID